MPFLTAPQSYVGHLITPRQCSGGSLAPCHCQNLQKIFHGADLQNEILRVACSTPSSPMDAACHAPGVPVLLCIVHFG